VARIICTWCTYAVLDFAYVEFVRANQIPEVPYLMAEAQNPEHRTLGDVPSRLITIYNDVWSRASRYVLVVRLLFMRLPLADLQLHLKSQDCFTETLSWAFLVGS
jgi:hypothetical protein